MVAGYRGCAEDEVALLHGGGGERGGGTGAASKDIQVVVKIRSCGGGSNAWSRGKDLAALVLYYILFNVVRDRLAAAVGAVRV